MDLSHSTLPLRLRLVGAQRHVQRRIVHRQGKAQKPGAGASEQRADGWAPLPERLGYSV